MIRVGPWPRKGDALRRGSPGDVARVEHALIGRCCVSFAARVSPGHHGVAADGDRGWVIGRRYRLKTNPGWKPRQKPVGVVEAEMKVEVEVAGLVEPPAGVLVSRSD